MRTIRIATHKADLGVMLRIWDEELYKAMVLQDLWRQCMEWWQSAGRPAFQNVRIVRESPTFDIFYYIYAEVLPGETIARLPDDPPPWLLLDGGHSV